MKLLLIDAMHVIGNILAMDRSSGLTESFCSEIERMKRTVNPSHMLICFDDLSRSWRRQLSFEYKQSCNGMPLPLRIEAAGLASVMENLGYKTSCQSTMEARDIIGSVMYRIEQNENMKEVEIAVVAGGARYLPMVSSQTYLYSPYSGANSKSPQVKTLDVVKSMYGFSGKALLEFLSLTGDTATSISGVKGVGATTAQKLLGEYGTLKELHAHKAMVEGSIGDKLRSGLAPDGDCLRSYKLLNYNKGISIGMNFSELDVSSVRRAA